MAAVTPFELLASAIELVASGWCQGALARDERGQAVDAGSSEARSWSAPGAIVAAWQSSCRTAEARDLALDSFISANLALAASVPISPEEWNDAPERTREQVLQALNRAATMIEWPSAGDTRGRPTLARLRRRLITHGPFDHSEEYDYSEAYEVLSASDEGQFVLRAASGDVTFFQAGGLYADIEIRCDACQRWADHVAPTNEEELRWICHGGASPCDGV